MSSSVLAGNAAALPTVAPTPGTTIAIDATAQAGMGEPVPPVSADSYAELRRLSIEIAPLAELSVDEQHVPEVWVVERGDHLWGIAFETVSEHLGTSPSERRVVRYWQRLIDANQDRLVIAGEPDYIVPGQCLVLPAPNPRADQRSGT